ncbi:unnamed protein product [Ixodes pacificus]
MGVYVRIVGPSGGGISCRQDLCRVHAPQIQDANRERRQLLHQGSRWCRPVTSTFISLRTRLSVERLLAPAAHLKPCTSSEPRNNGLPTWFCN